MLSKYQRSAYYGYYSIRIKKLSILYLFERLVLWVMMLPNGVVVGPVVGAQEAVAALIRIILGTRV